MIGLKVVVVCISVKLPPPRNDALNILILSVARAYKNDLEASSNVTNAASPLRASVNEVLLEACFTLI